MTTKPPTAELYTPTQMDLVRRACLTLATYLGSYLEDVVVVADDGYRADLAGAATELLRPLDHPGR